LVTKNNDTMDKQTPKKKNINIILVYTIYTIYDKLNDKLNDQSEGLSPAFYFLSRFYHHYGSRDCMKDENFHLYVRLGFEGDPSVPGTIPVGLKFLLPDRVLGRDDPLPFHFQDETFYLFLTDRLLGPFLPMHDRMDVPDRSFVEDPERWITTYFRNPFLVKNIPVVIEGRSGEDGILAMGVSGSYLNSYRFKNVEEVFQNPGSRWKIPDDIVESIFVFQHGEKNQDHGTHDTPSPVFLRRRSLCPLKFIFVGIHLIDNTGASRVVEKLISTLRDKQVIVVPFVLKCDLVITERNKDIENTITRWWREYPNLVPVEDVKELKSLLGYLWQQDTLYRDGFSSSLSNVLLERYTLILNTMVGYEKFRGILKENYFGRKILIVHESWKKELQELQREFSQYLDDVVFVSQATRELLFSPGKFENAHNGFRSSVLYNCSLLEDSVLEQRRVDKVSGNHSGYHSGYQTSKVRFLIAGSVEPRKSQLKFLQKVWVPFVQTMNRIRKEKPSTPEIELVMIGYNRLFNKEERRIFESICETYPEEIIYKGPLEDPTEEFLRCDVCLSTSVEESLPLNVLDAMCASKPVVAADTFGIQELIVDEETGLIIDSGSSTSDGCDDDGDDEPKDNNSPYPILKPRYYNNSRFLTDFVMALDRVVQNKRMREEMGRKGRERYEENFSLDRFKKGYKLLMEGPTFLLHVHQNDPFQSIGLGNRLKSMASGMIILESMGKPKEGVVVGYEKDHPDMKKLFTSNVVFREKRKGGEKYTIDWLSQFSSHPWYTWRWVVTKQDEVDSYEDMTVMMNTNTSTGVQVLYPFEKDEIERLQKFHKTSSFEDERGGGGSSVVDFLDSNSTSSSTTQGPLSPLYKGVSLETIVDFMYENTPKKIRERILRVVDRGLRKNIHPRLQETKRRVLDFLEKRALEGQQNTLKGIDLYEGAPSCKNILRFRHPIGSKTRLDRRSLFGFGGGDNTNVKQPQRKQKIYRISVALRTWESDRYTERFEDEPGKPLRRFMIHDYLRKVRDIISEIDKKHPDQGSYVVTVLISSDNSMMETVFAQMVSKLHDVFPQLIRTQILEDEVLSQCYDNDRLEVGMGKDIDKISTPISTKSITNDELSMVKILLLADQADYLVGDTISTFTELVWYFGDTRPTTCLVGPYFFDPMIKNK